MLRKLCWLCVLLIPLLLSQCLMAAKLPGKYFHKIIWDDFYHLKPIQEIAKPSAIDGVYYVVDFDKSQRPIRVARMIEGELRRDPVSKVAVTRIDYVPGRILTRFFSERWQPANDRTGVHTIEANISPANNPLSIRFYDVDNKVAENKDNIVEVQYETSADKHQRTVRFFDEKGQQTVDAHGWYELRCAMNDQGQVAEQVNYDANHQILDSIDGFSTVRFTYDEAGQVATRLEYGHDATKVPEHYAQTIWSYDQKGIVQQVEYSLVKVDKQKFWEAGLGFVNAARQFNDGQLVKQAKAMWTL